MPETTPDAAAEARRAAYVDALLEERRGYEQQGNKARLADVDAELKAAGYTPPKARAAKADTAVEA